MGKPFVSIRVLLLLFLCAWVGCTIDRGPVYIRDGKSYGASPDIVWRDTWWQNYERGLSYAEGGYWQDAIASFQNALASRLSQFDQRYVNTYGLHFIDHYFPHRELGIVYYHLGRYNEALQELSTSLHQTESAKAKFYLNRVRKRLLQQAGRDTTPPRIQLLEPTHDVLTNHFYLRVRGVVEDETSVSAVSIHGRPLRIDLAEPTFAFDHQVLLQDGLNVIQIVAEDLLGQQTVRHIRVTLDRQGPLLSITRATRSTATQAQVQGILSDASSLTRFLLAGQPMPLPSALPGLFSHQIPISAGERSLAFEVVDAASNVTRGDIDLTSLSHATLKQRHGQRLSGSRWAWVDTAGPIMDNMLWPQLAAATPPDRDPPSITLTSIQDQHVVYTDVVYLEGKVVDVSSIQSFFIDRESYWKHACKQLFFGYLAPLRSGQLNAFLLEAVDKWQNRSERSIHIQHRVPPLYRLDSRFSVVLMSFAPNEYAGRLYAGVQDHLSTALSEQKRFQLIAPDASVSQHMVRTETDASKAGALMQAEGVIIGTVIESQTHQSLEVFARLVDVDTKQVFASADVYGEQLAPRDVKTLMNGLAFNLQQAFPIATGTIIAKEGQQLWVDLTQQDGMKPGMKLLVFREGGVIEIGGRRLQKPASVLGQARIQSMTADLSEAQILPLPFSDKIRESDQVMTK